MQHIQIVEALPLPVFGVGFIGAFFQALDGAIGGGAQEFVIILELRWEPPRGALGKDALQKSQFAPMVELRVLAKMGFEDEIERAVQRCVQERILGAAKASSEQAQDERHRAEVSFLNAALYPRARSHLEPHLGQDTELYHWRKLAFLQRVLTERPARGSQRSSRIMTNS